MLSGTSGITAKSHAMFGVASFEFGLCCLRRVPIGHRYCATSYGYYTFTRIVTCGIAACSCRISGRPNQQSMVNCLGTHCRVVQSDISYSRRDARGVDNMLNSQNRYDASRAPRRARCKWKAIRSFKMKSGFRSCASAAASSSASGISRHKITHTFTSIWAMPMKSSAPIVLRYSLSIQAWAQTKPTRQIVLTKRQTEKDTLDPFTRWS